MLLRHNVLGIGRSGRPSVGILYFTHFYLGNMYTLNYVVLSSVIVISLHTVMKTSP